MLKTLIKETNTKEITKYPFIVIEGIDKTGKSTIARKICEIKNYKLYEYPNRTTPIGKIIDSFLKRESYSYYDFHNQNQDIVFSNVSTPSVVSEPTTFCKPIQTMCDIELNNQESKVFTQQTRPKNELTPEVATLLFAANRYESVSSIINRETGIVTARYKHSAIGTAKINQLNVDWVRNCDSLLPSPTHLFFIDSNFDEVTTRRTNESNERYEGEDKAKQFHKDLKNECVKEGATILEGGHSLDYYVTEILKYLEKDENLVK
ncbi:Thymidylate kinase [Cucumispora dikerogammari]|nr:Thymidylate kinase [Cucumispora dikerogammari]